MVSILHHCLNFGGHYTLIDNNEKKLPSKQFKDRYKTAVRPEVASSAEIETPENHSEAKRILSKNTHEILSKAQASITSLVNKGSLSPEKATALQTLCSHVERNINNPIEQEKLEQIIKLTKELSPKNAELKKLAKTLTSALSTDKAISSSEVNASGPRM
jgi:translation initiation factor 1 (eIF-1/SUI1)